MRVDDEQPVRPGGGECVGDGAGTDRLPGVVAAVLTGIAEVGDNGGDPAGAGPTAGVEEQQQLDEPVVDRRPGGLHDVDVVTADRRELGAQLTVGEPVHRAGDGFVVEVVTDHGGEPVARRAGDYPRGHDDTRGWRAQPAGTTRASGPGKYTDSWPSCQRTR